MTSMERCRYAELLLRIERGEPYCSASPPKQALNLGVIFWGNFVGTYREAASAGALIGRPPRTSGVKGSTQSLG